MPTIHSKLREMPRWLYSRWVTFKPWVAAGCVVLLASWTGSECKAAFGTLIHTGTVEGATLAALVIAGVLFMLAVIWLYRIRKLLLYPHTRLLRNESPPQREHLILFLSNLPNDPEYVNGVPGWVQLTGDLDHDLNILAGHKKANRRWSWEMPLRGIKHHLGTLKTVTLICSAESVRQVHWFGQLLKEKYATPLANVAVKLLVKTSGRPVLIGCPVAPREEGGWEFEKFDDLSQAMLSLLRAFRQQEIGDEQMMVDFTGGQKVTSVVAASVTFNRQIKAQYVQTNEPYGVIGYDVLLTSTETPGMGW
jgi:hypothetical protein